MCVGRLDEHWLEVERWVAEGRRIRAFLQRPLGGTEKAMFTVALKEIPDQTVQSRRAGGDRTHADGVPGDSGRLRCGGGVGGRANGYALLGPPRETVHHPQRIEVGWLVDRSTSEPAGQPTGDTSVAETFKTAGQFVSTTDSSPGGRSGDHRHRGR